ncbi:MAG: hypothetical protein V3R79_03005 [Alphaproteobacteria bacterium]
MSDLTAAREQLEKAITRLESALSEQPGGTGNAAVDKALQDARAEHQNLRAVAESVSGRIDDVIARLRATRGENAGGESAGRGA